MANSTKTKATKTATQNKATVKKTVSASPDVVQTTPTNTTTKNYVVKNTLDPAMYVTVKNGFHGTLIYKSKKTQEKFIWEAFGDEQDIELQELKNAKNSSKAFFENNWFLIDDPEVIEYLGVSRYYKNALDCESLEELFFKTPEEIIDIISKLSYGQKKSVTYRAKQLIAEKTIDSLKVIDALEKSLGVELIEKAD